MRALSWVSNSWAEECAGDNRFPLLDAGVAGCMLVAMRIILIPLALVAAAVIAMVLLAARGRPPTPVGPALAMNASFP
jgi:hypothetical protein